MVDVIENNVIWRDDDAETVSGNDGHNVFGYTKKTLKEDLEAKKMRIKNK